MSGNCLDGCAASHPLARRRLDQRSVTHPCPDYTPEMPEGKRKPDLREFRACLRCCVRPFDGVDCRWLTPVCRVRGTQGGGFVLLAGRRARVGPARHCRFAIATQPRLTKLIRAAPTTRWSAKSRIWVWVRAKGFCYDHEVLS